MMTRTGTTPFLFPYSDRTVVLYGLSRSPALKRLSRRQLEVAWMVADGMSDKAVAQALDVNPRTVRTYVHRIAARLDLNRSRNIRTQITALVVLAWANLEEAA